MRVPLSLVFLLLVFCFSQPGFSQSTVTPAVTAPGDGRVADHGGGDHGHRGLYAYWSKIWPEIGTVSLGNEGSLVSMSNKPL